MFEDENSFLPQIKQFLLSISSDARVRLAVFVVMSIVGIFSIGYGVVSLVASGRVASEPCVVEAPEAYLLAQEVRNAKRDAEPSGLSNDDRSDSKNIIYVDVSGAVENPGIYQMNVGERMAVALELAGGVVTEGLDSQRADLMYLSKELNLAKEVLDGDKIYIPFFIESNVAIDVNGNSDAKKNTQNNTGEINGSKNEIGNNQDYENDTVSLNNSSLKQLMELVGVGEKRAEDIISNRPYSNISDVVGKAVLTQSVFDKNKR